MTCNISHIFDNRPTTTLADECKDVLQYFIISASAIVFLLLVLVIILLITICCMAKKLKSKRAAARCNHNEHEEGMKALGGGFGMSESYRGISSTFEEDATINTHYEGGPSPETTFQIRTASAAEGNIEQEMAEVQETAKSRHRVPFYNDVSDIPMRSKNEDGVMKQDYNKLAYPLHTPAPDSLNPPQASTSHIGGYSSLSNDASKPSHPNPGPNNDNDPSLFPPSLPTFLNESHLLQVAIIHEVGKSTNEGEGDDKPHKVTYYNNSAVRDGNGIESYETTVVNYPTGQFVQNERPNLPAVEEEGRSSSRETRKRGSWYVNVTEQRS